MLVIKFIHRPPPLRINDQSINEPHEFALDSSVVVQSFQHRDMGHGDGKVEMVNCRIIITP